MKVRIEAEKTLPEDEVVKRCRELNGAIQKIQQSILQLSPKVNLVFYQENIEYYLPLHSILFFETSPDGINAHTTEHIYQVKNKLYEMEELLPVNFVRISKSSIVNADHIYSIDRTLGSTGRIEFNRSHKQVYVSRNYYKMLKLRLEERRNCHG